MLKEYLGDGEYQARLDKLQKQGEIKMDKMDDTQKYLESLDEEHDPAIVEEFSIFSNLPDGEYQVRLDKLYISRSKKERVQCVWDFEVISGPHAFRTIMKFSGMDTATGLDFLTRDLRKAGINNFKWSDVQTQFSKPLDKLFLLKLETKIKNEQSFQAIYILKTLDPSEVLVSKSLEDNKDVPF